MRPIILTDEGPYMDLHADPDVVKFFGPPIPKAPGQLLMECQRLDELGLGDRLRAVADVYENFAGRCGLWLESSLVTLDVVLCAQWRNCGLGTKVLAAMLDYSKREYSEKHIGACVHPENGPAIGVLKKFGFYRDAKSTPLRPHTSYEMPQDLYRYPNFPR